MHGDTMADLMKSRRRNREHRRRKESEEEATATTTGEDTEGVSGFQASMFDKSGGRELLFFNGDVSYFLIRWRRHHVRESWHGQKCTIYYRSSGAQWSYNVALYKFCVNVLF